MFLTVEETDWDLMKDISCLHIKREFLGISFNSRLYPLSGTRSVLRV